MDRLKITGLLSCVLTGVLLFGTTVYASGDANIRSYGKVQAVDDQGQSVVIDADDIRQNYAAILQIKNQLAGLDGKTLQWSDTMGTYVIVTYRKDQNGLVVSDSNGKPIIESEEAIGALGTADPTMVVENRTFSSLYAKTVYRGASTTKNPGVEQNGTLVDILNNGWTADQIAGTPYYAVSDTKGTGSSTREKGGAISGTRTHDLAFGAYNAQANTHNTKVSLSPTNTVFDIGVNQSVTLPAGYYDKGVTVRTGVIDRTRTNDLALGTYSSSTNTHNTKVSLSPTNTTVDIGVNQSITLPVGYYDQGVTIRTGVIDRQTVSWGPSGKGTYTLQPGYYSGGTFTTDNAYQAGYTEGRKSVNPLSGVASIVYTYHHHTTGGNANNTSGSPGAYGNDYQSPVYGGCFTIPYYHYKYYRPRTKCGHWRGYNHTGSGSDEHATFECTGCGAKVTEHVHADPDGSGWGKGDHYLDEINIDEWTTDSSKYPSSYIVETRYLRSCGKNECQILEAHIKYN